MNDVVETEYVVVGLGALGSATTWQLARRGADVVGLEQFELGHNRGASHDTSRIIRHSYHTAAYVDLTFAAYDDWADLESVSGEQFVTVTGGVDLFPADAAIPIDTYTTSMDACDVPYDVLTAAEAMRRWPQFALAADTTVLHQARTGIVPAARSTATTQRLAAAAGAWLYARSPVVGLHDVGGQYDVVTAERTFRCRRVVVTADAWTNDVIGHLGAEIPLTVLQEQVTYLQPAEPSSFAAERFPVWIWMDDPSYYGFPCYGATTVKSAQDCGGHPVDPHTRTGDVEPGAERRLVDFVSHLLPGAGSTVTQSKTCLYTLTPDRDFVLGPLPDHDGVIVGLAAAHGMKFAPTFGRLLADLARDGRTETSIEPFRLDRPALTSAAAATSWLV